MGQIQRLDAQTITQIAAGEVIERPASIVRELLDNALDAQASQVHVYTADGGISYVEVQDNGCGMDTEDILLCIQEHTTSKVRVLDDLQRLQTMGFRGEALASIAAVGKLQLSSRAEEEASGRYIQVERGALVENKAVGRKPGTTVIVRGLFAEHPARLKFLSTPSVETRHIDREVLIRALAFPELRLDYTVNTVKKMEYFPVKTRLERIQEVFPQLQDYLSSVSVTKDGWSAEIFFTHPSFSSPQRQYQFLFVNRRAIEWKAFYAMITEVYRGMLPAGMHSGVLIYLTMDPSLVDFNVHPAKREARFKQSTRLAKDVRDALDRAVLTYSVQQASGTAGQLRMQPVTWRKAQTPSRHAPTAHTYELGLQATPVTAPTPAKLTPQLPGVLGTSAELSDSLPENTMEVVLPTDDTPSDYDSANLLSYRLVGALFQTYLLLEGSDRLVFIDQHAVHERITYEKLRLQFEGKLDISERLLVPLSLHIPVLHAEQTEAALQILAKSGFDVDDMGHGSYVVRAAPRIVPYGDIEPMVLALFDAAGEGDGFRAADFFNEAIARMACRRSIKGGETLSAAEVWSLLSELQELERQSTCPHGRPVMFFVPKKDLDKNMKRLGF